VSTTVHPGRATADVDGEVVLFLIGMRINRLRAVRRWLPTALAMGPMLAELQRHPELGLLGVRTYRSGRTILTVQYWRSAAHLERFATGRDLPHLPAWKAFNRRSAGSGAVGVFHETYRVTAGSYEALYSDMPEFGLAAATRRIPADRLGRGFRRRLARTAGDTPAATAAAEVPAR
jgi:hypothetical protein